MRVIFVEDVPQVAYVGEVKNVADGYARNYLLPGKMAVPATAQALKLLDAQIKGSAHRRVRAESDLTELANALEGTTLTFKARVGAQERLYGSITNAQIADELEKVMGRPFDKRRVELAAPLRSLGSHEVALRLARNLTPKIKVVIEEEAAQKAAPAAQKEAAPKAELPAEEPSPEPKETVAEKEETAAEKEETS